jgi:hypothetical protein
MKDPEKKNKQGRKSQLGKDRANLYKSTQR